ncbi:MAG: iron-containing alcohol dehydrogenase [Cyclobacteriaceae bacterium]|nr:iron-containing alcohol dehydrogenase [Cyclobacteriaceae bacterium]
MGIDFKFAASPAIIFGSGKLSLLPKHIEGYGKSILLVTGKHSFVQSAHWKKLGNLFETTHISWEHCVVEKEPTPGIIDGYVSQYRDRDVDVVVAIGGGSVVDAGKAISAMWFEQGSVAEYLEGVGTRQTSGQKLPFIAVPTTAGTGSETTKNAVISEVGAQGYKKSIRHDRYVPDIALVDPKLMLNCPKSVTAQSGMDAFTQLLEAYLSIGANPMSDALAVDGIRKVRDSLVVAVNHGQELLAREGMAYAAMLSGLVLANAGLGTVHGFASSIGGYFDIPHGLICARMMAPVNQLTVAKLRKEHGGGERLWKYARIGKLFSKDKNTSDAYYIDLLLGVIGQWTDGFAIPGLGAYGVTENDFEKIIDNTSNKFNPIDLDRDELHEALRMAL